MFEVTIDMYRDQFIEIARNNIKRDGIDKLLEYLDTTDFYTCPASTKYHGSYDYGLVMHSINVYNALVDFYDNIIYKGTSWRYEPDILESATIVALFHDLCKINKYVKYQKNVKDEFGQWYQEEAYTYNKDQFRMGHSAGSLHIINKFMCLKDEEAQAIYWHMGAFDLSPYSSSNDLSVVFNNNILAFSLHMADMLATYIDENENIVSFSDTAQQ